jgi:hypothetical protein
MQAISLNGTEVAMNRRAFGLGRIAAARPELVATWLRGHELAAIPDTLGDLLADRMPRLTAWAGPARGAAWAKRYRALVAKVEAAEAALPGSEGRLSRAVAHVAAKLMTYKDEYEVGRLFSDPAFAARLRETFAAVRAARPGNRAAAEAALRRLDGQGLRRPRQIARAAGHAAGRVRLPPAPPRRAGADPRV